MIKTKNLIKKIFTGIPKIVRVLLFKITRTGILGWTGKVGFSINKSNSPSLMTQT